MLFNFNRRAFHKSSLGGVFAYALQHRMQHLFADEVIKSTKRCIVLWMGGGPSQLDTFDPKPGSTTGGPIRAVPTSVPGIQIAEALPEIGKRMDSLSIIRSLTSPEGDHDRGSHYLHTGYPFVQAFPRPTLGSIVSHENPASDSPLFVSLGASGLGPAYMGPDHAPFAVEDPQQARELITGLHKQRNVMRQIEQFSDRFDREHFNGNLERRRASLQKIERMLTTPFVKALDVERAPATDKQRYGSSTFGQRCLLAKRLLATGVKFVEVQHDGWDTHEDNFQSVNELCQEIDAPWANLIDDLKASGLWDETVVVWMGEFGRTPQINGNNGRDHFPMITPVVLGGGGVKGGQVIGKTDRYGLQIEDGLVRVPDLFATLLTALGIDPNHEFRTEFGATAPASDKGVVIPGLLI